MRIHLIIFVIITLTCTLVVPKPTLQAQLPPSPLTPVDFDRLISAKGNEPATVIRIIQQKRIAFLRQNKPLKNSRRLILSSSQK